MYETARWEARHCTNADLWRVAPAVNIIFGKDRCYGVMTNHGRTKDWNNPCSVQRFERAILIGIQSADFIKASGHGRRKIRPDIWKHPTKTVSSPKNPLPAGAIHIWTRPIAFIISKLIPFPHQSDLM